MELCAGLGNLAVNGDLFKAFVAHKLGLQAAHNALFAVQQVAAGFIQSAQLLLKIKEWNVEYLDIRNAQWLLFSVSWMSHINQDICGADPGCMAHMG